MLLSWLHPPSSASDTVLSLSRILLRPPPQFCLSSLFRVTFLPYSPFIRERASKGIPQISVPYPQCLPSLSDNFPGFPSFFCPPLIPMTSVGYMCLQGFRHSGDIIITSNWQHTYSCTDWTDLSTLRIFVYTSQVCFHALLTHTSTFGSAGPTQGCIWVMTDYNPWSFIVWQKQKVR